MKPDLNLEKWCPETDLNRRHADFQSSHEDNDFSSLAAEKFQDKARTASEPDTARHPAEMAYVVFGRAVADLPPEGRMIALERAFAVLRAGEPIPALINLMAEARDWAAWASPSELKAYALASFEKLTARDQAAFLSHIGGRAVA